MNEKLPVFITGLPRMGSTSVAEAMKILGYSVSHFCPITNKRLDFFKDLDFKTVDCYVSSHFLGQPPNREGIWILLDRDFHDWEESMKNIGEDIKSWKMDISSYHGIDCPDVFVYNVLEGWPPLCKFLNKPIPSSLFPHVNKSPQNYQI